MKGYRFCLWKAYFDKGYGLTSYVKYLIVLMGLAEGFATQALSKTLIVAVIYAVACFFIGHIWYKTGLVISEAEVSNRFNLFQIEMRQSLNNQKV